MNEKEEADNGLSTLHAPTRGRRRTDTLGGRPRTWGGRKGHRVLEQ